MRPVSRRGSGVFITTSGKVWDALKFEIHARHLGMEQSEEICDLRFSQTAYGK